MLPQENRLFPEGISALKLRRKTKQEDLAQPVQAAKETLELEVLIKSQGGPKVEKKVDLGPLRKETCEECKKSEFVLNRAEGTIVCTNCGLVQQSRVIDETSEWRNFSNENSGGGQSSLNRVGGKLNPYMSDFGLSTMVKGAGAKEAVLWSQRTAMNAQDKTILKGHSRIKEVATCVNIKEATVDKAMQLYKQICDSNLLKGMSIDARVATCLFMATRLMDQHKPIKKILAYTECSEKELSKCYKKVKCMFPQHQTRLHASKIAEQVCVALKLPIDITQACKITSDNLSSLQMLEGKKPQTIAGAAVYLIIEESEMGAQVSIDNISKAVDIKPQTIMETCRLTSSLKSHILPEFWVSQRKK